MNIKQFRYSSDNLGYLIYGKDSALAIDGGAVQAILDFVKIISVLEKRGLPVNTEYERWESIMSLI